MQSIPTFNNHYSRQHLWQLSCTGNTNGAALPQATAAQCNGSSLRGLHEGLAPATKAATIASPHRMITGAAIVAAHWLTVPRAACRRHHHWQEPAAGKGASSARWHHDCSAQGCHQPTWINQANSDSGDWQREHSDAGNSYSYPESPGWYHI